MPYINLIEEQRSIERKKDSQARIGLYTFAGVLVIVVLGYGAFYTSALSLQNQQASLDARMQAVAPKTAEIEKNKKLDGELRPKVESLENAQAMTDHWISILNHLRTQMPENTWLTAIRSSDTDATKPITVTMTGMTMAQEPVANFILRAQNSPDLEDVNLHYTSEKTSAYGQTIEFEVGANIKGTEPPPKEPTK